MDTKIVIKEENILSDDMAIENETLFFASNTNRGSVLLDSDCGVAIKREMKSETQSSGFCGEKEGLFLWLEPDSSSVFGVIKDGDFSLLKSPRLCKAVSGDSSGDLPSPSAEALEKNKSFLYEKGYPEDESDVTKTPAIVNLEQSGKCSGRGKIYSKALSVKKGERSHKCNICNKSFTQLSALKSHNLIHEGIKPHKCEICDKSFIRLSDLKRHNLIHEGKKAHKCEICEKRFTLLSHLKTHNLIHYDKKYHKCEVCEKSFIRLSDLKRHNLIHEGKKPHKCEICEKRFTFLSHLKAHNLIHEGKKPHKCDICEQRFTLSSNLKRHNLTHEGKKPHKCEICEKRFTLLSNLKRHNLKHESK